MTLFLPSLKFLASKVGQTMYGQRPKYFIAFSLYYNLTNKKTKEYNRIYLMHERKPWSPQEDDLIRRSIKANGLLKWKKILTWIKNVDPNFSRNSKQMRERWKFHLDPNLIKQQWSEREEEILFKSHMLKGSRWKEIQKLLPGRSEKSIKNYFYMTLRKSLRRVTKIMGAKNSTDQTRQLKANVLTKIVESANQNPQKRQSIYRLFNLHKLRNGQCKKANILEEDIIVFRELMDDILKYNELYTINKKMGLSALEEKITSLKSENCVTENVGDKSTVAGRSTVPGLLSDPDIDIEEEGEQFEEDQAPNQVRDGQPNLYEQYTFLVEGQSMKGEDLFSP